MKREKKLQITTETAIGDDQLLGNICIAKFMGINPIKGISEHTVKEYYYYNNSKMQDFEALPCYNKDWSELMPVVEKINKRDLVAIYNDECKIHALLDGEFETIDIINKGQHLIKSVFEAVVKYAEWHLLNVS